MVINVTCREADWQGGREVGWHVNMQTDRQTDIHIYTTQIDK